MINLKSCKLCCEKCRCVFVRMGTVAHFITVAVFFSFLFLMSYCNCPQYASSYCVVLTSVTGKLALDVCLQVACKAGYFSLQMLDPLCRCHTVLKLTPDGHMIKEMLKFSSDHKNIGIFVRVILSRHMTAGGVSQALGATLEWWQNLWHAKKLPKDLAKIHSHVKFSC